MKLLLISLPLFLILNGCFFQKKSTSRKKTKDASESTTQTDPYYPTNGGSNTQQPYPQPDPPPTTPTSGVSPYSFIITGHGKSKYSSGIIWSSKTDPSLQGVQNQSKFNTDYRLKIRIKALDRPQAGYQASAEDNYGNTCTRADYIYSKIKVLVGIKAIGSSTYLEKKYIDASINSFSTIAEFTAPSAGNFSVDILELKNDSWCKTYTESGYEEDAVQMGYCPFAEETSFSCSQLELHLSTDWTNDFF